MKLPTPNKLIWESKSRSGAVHVSNRESLLGF
jgi:hypothetical protein